MDDLGLMKRFWANMNPTVRGFLVIAAISLTVVVLNLYNVLASLAILARVAFLLAIAFFVFLLWRERREEIATWPVHARLALYGAAILIAFDLLVFGFWGASGLGAVAFLLVLVICGYAGYRAWRSQHTYGY
jgi:small-conductance mechanosensitive channel